MMFPCEASFFTKTTSPSPKWGRTISQSMVRSLKSGYFHS